MPTVTASGWMSNSLQAVEDILANCAAFQALMGVATVALARGKVVWQCTRGEMTAPYTLIRIMDGGSVSEPATRLPEHVDTVSVLLVWPEITGGTTASDVARAQLNAFGALLDQIAGLVGTSTYLARAERSYEAPEILSDDGPHVGCWSAVITFNWTI
jgi:hypothetical protein